MIAIITTTIIIPDHKPTLKIPSIASQEVSDTINRARAGSKRLFFILNRFTSAMQKPYPVPKPKMVPIGTIKLVHTLRTK
jgi:hypothetical protein